MSEAISSGGAVPAELAVKVARLNDTVELVEAAIADDETVEVPVAPAERLGEAGATELDTANREMGWRLRIDWIPSDQGGHGAGRVANLQQIPLSEDRDCWPPWPKCHIAAVSSLRQLVAVRRWSKSRRFLPKISSDNDPA